MPISFAALQFYDNYLTTYYNRNRRSSRYDTHDSKELKYLYSTIQRKNRFAPIYLEEPSSNEITYAVNLKEQAKALHETIDSLSGDDEEQLFSTKTAYSSQPDLVSVSYDEPDENQVSSYDNVPSHFVMSIESFATPQTNTSGYLPANQTVKMPPGSYSFDLITSKLHYELQFELQEHDTNEQLQQRLRRLINNSDLSVHAEVLHKDGQTALQITSDALGAPLQGRQHFRITDENTSHSKGMVDYLELNHSVEKASNASYVIDGERFYSYNNSFKVYDAYELTLNTDKITKLAGNSSRLTDIEIGLYPDPQSLAYNLESFVKSYNNFVSKTQSQEEQFNRLGLDMHKLLALHKNAIEKYGIQVSSDNTLSFPDSYTVDNPPYSDTKELQNFGSHLLRKLNSIALDPMEYLNRNICAYSNPSTKGFVNPYMTSIYSGMLFNTYC